LLLRLVCDAILERQIEGSEVTVVGDKSPNENGVRAVEWLSAIYPDAKVIYIVRDGRDTILSKRIQAFIDQPQWLARKDRRLWDQIIRNPDSFANRRQSIFTDEWLIEAAQVWAEHVEKCTMLGTRNYGANFYSLRYEDLIESPAEQQSEVWRFLGGESPDGVLLEALNEEMKRNPAAEWHNKQEFRFLEKVPRGVQGGWKEIFTERDLALFEEHAGDALMEWGYSLYTRNPVNAVHPGSSRSHDRESQE
jgi:hypothetical protein